MPYLYFQENGVTISFVTHSPDAGYKGSDKCSISGFAELPGESIFSYFFFAKPIAHRHDIAVSFAPAYAEVFSSVGL